MTLADEPRDLDGHIDSPGVAATVLSISDAASDKAGSPRVELNSDNPAEP